MSTTESGSRTSEPLAPAHEGSYTGSWSDWITGTPAPARSSRAERYEAERYERAAEPSEEADRYDSEYGPESYPDDYDNGEFDNGDFDGGHFDGGHFDDGDFDDEDDDYDEDGFAEPRSIDALSHARTFDPPYSEDPSRASSPRDPARAPASGDTSRTASSRGPAHPRSSEDTARDPDSEDPSGRSPDDSARARQRYRSPRARTAYAELRARSSFDPAQAARGDRLDPPPGYPTARRPLKRAARPTPARERLGLSLDFSGRQWVVPLLGLLAVLAVTAAIAVQIAKVTGDNTPSKPVVAAPHPATPSAIATGTASPTASALAQPAAGPADLCPNEAKGGNVRGNGPGSTKSGPDVILALQNRYYVDRSGKAVREMFAPDAAAPTVEQIQAGIDSIPVGTTYCVQIMPGPFDGQHVMVVSEQHPDASKRTWSPQLVITTKVGDATLISAIVPMNEDTPK
ncbi:hypothetical protein GPX89_09665 [Nocardia sp. ET3-3]|uniref:DUF8176 domain-containing protein n=1 Tax=Nocardia terrae TaxID=2675851 RepID=A0A7K1UT29_9NOCA|nr:hypothetical protein [Nocardia terrae]MVU77512.1 hypothetical protein [Nocardia terrae]